MVKRTWLCSLCLSKSGGVPRMCVGVVESVKRDGYFRKISLIKP